MKVIQNMSPQIKKKLKNISKNTKNSTTNVTMKKKNKNNANSMPLTTKIAAQHPEKKMQD